MTWNYRVVRSEDRSGPYYEIYEVYYDAAGKPDAWTKQAVRVGADDRPGLLWQLSVMAKAVAKPVLQVDGDTLIEVEPATILSDELRRVLDEVEAMTAIEEKA